MGENGHVSSTSDMLDVATSFYKKLFAFEPKPAIHLGTGFWNDSDLVSMRRMNYWKGPFLKVRLRRLL